MPLPKGINRPEVRAAWIAQRQVKIAEFDRLVSEGMSGTKAARQVGMCLSAVGSTRVSIERLEGRERFGRGLGSHIDLGLALLSAVRRPGESLTQEDIAAWCDCTGAAIQLIERRALRKLRERLGRMFDPVELELAYQYLAARVAPETLP